MAETDNGWGIACRMAADATSVWLGTLTDAARASISSNDSDALESDMRAAIRAALHEHTDQRGTRLFELLGAMVPRWPEGSLDDICQLAGILDVEIWTRVTPNPDQEFKDELRFRPCPEGPDVEPDVLMGEDTTGWERLDGPPEGEP